MYELSITVLLSAGLILGYHLKKSLNVIIMYLEKENDLMNGVNVEELSSYEIEKQQREREFDDRISGLQKELDMLDGFGTPAETLHEDVYNLPHSRGVVANGVIVNKDDIEIAD